MKDIKFRAWDKKNNEMVNFENIYIELEDGCMDVYKLILNSFGLDDVVQLDTSEGNVVLMQYTGLQDRNGKDVYEGDILRITDETDGDDFVTNGVVEWLHDFWNVSVIENSLYELKRSGYVEVIGDIYTRIYFLMHNLHPVPKTTHKRFKPTRKQRGEFSKVTIKRIFERDGYRCVRCGTGRDLERKPHHILFRSQGGPGTEDNGVTICIPCHRWAHSCREGREWFEQYRTTYLMKGEEE